MPNLVATHANYPALARALLPHLRYVWTDSSLPLRHRALLGLRTAWLTQSDYLWAHRARLARENGFSEAELERIARGAVAGDWDAFEATLLQAADELYVDSFISDATWAALAERYDLPQLIDTIDTVGALTMHAGVVNSIRLALEPGIDEPLPDVPYAVTAEKTNRRLVDAQPRIAPTPPEGGGPIFANVFNTFVHNPPADRVRGAINTHVNGNSLDPRQREFLLVRIGILCRSEYEYAAHVRSGFRVGMTGQDLELILAGPDSGAGDPLDIALLRATDELYHDDRISADTWQVLAAALSTEQLFDVMIAVGGYRSTSMLINSAGVQLDENMAEFRLPPELR
jgi:4-carboxymuconolactone decarboxylase